MGPDRGCLAWKTARGRAAWVWNTSSPGTPRVMRALRRAVGPDSLGNEEADDGNMSTVYILWDESQIWGLLMWRALCCLGFFPRLVRGPDISQGLLSSKPPAVLIAPGGVARRKAEALGPRGMDALRDYVAAGGVYLGFCGGAGLGLTGEYGLGLCPWHRAPMRDRLRHLVSGHVAVSLHRGDPPHPFIPPDLLGTPLVPVWWPAGFEAVDGEAVEVLASYDLPGPDFWIADISLDSLPKGTFALWESTHDVNLRPSFLQGQPCVIVGSFGRGRYLLSYAHLETPRSPEANSWLAHILGSVAGPGTRGSRGAANPAAYTVADWDLSAGSVRWPAPSLLEARAALDEIITLGRGHFLLFPRNAWLLGWRAGIPGANINNLRSLLHTVLTTPPTPAGATFLAEREAGFLAALRQFKDEVTGYLLAERLAMTLAKSAPSAVSQQWLKAQRTRLFGEAMEQSGLYAQLLEVLDELVWLLLEGRAPGTTAGAMGSTGLVWTGRCPEPDPDALPDPGAATS